MDIEGTIKARRRTFVDRGEEVSAALQQAEERFKEAKLEEEELTTKKLPEVLANHALGKIPSVEVTKIRQRLRLLGQVIEEHPHLKRGLESEKARVGAEGYQFTFVEQHFKKYQAVKAEIEEKGLSSDRIDRLHLWAKQLSEDLDSDCLEDAKMFIDTIKEKQT